MPAPLTEQRTNPRLKVFGALLLAIAVAVLTVVFLQFRGTFTREAHLTMIAPRAGLVLDRGAKVTYNGVAIGRVADIGYLEEDGTSKAEITLDIDREYVQRIPANVEATVKATTVFGNKYVSFTSPREPAAERISSRDVIRVSAVTTEFNTLFETITSLAEKVDPVKLNATLAATAEALDGLGAKFGESIIDGNATLDDLNQRMPQIRYDTQRVADLAAVYADASPDLWDGLQHAATTARTFNQRRSDVDAALMAAIGFTNTGHDILNRGGPYLVRGAADLVPTSQLLDEYSPALHCTLRKYAEVGPKVADALGGNGFSLAAEGGGGVVFSDSPYIYPDNLPRVNAKGGPHGKPGCWADITRDLWPAPFLVMDTGASVAPYNHIEIAQPMLVDYVWGRQLGEFTINP